MLSIPNSGSYGGEEGGGDGVSGGDIGNVGGYVVRQRNNTLLFNNYVDTTSTMVYAMRIGTLNLSADVRQLIHSGRQKNTIYIVPIPDGISPYANEAQMPRMRGINRLYLYSSEPMDTRELDFVASQYVNGVKYDYPTLYGGVANGMVASVGKLPTCNFFIRNSDCPDDDFYSLIEMRWFRQRNHKTNKFYNEALGTTCALVAPENHPIPKVLIMPYDYRSLSPKRGYFFNPTCNLIVHVFGKCDLVSSFEESSSQAEAASNKQLVAATTGVVYDKQQGRKHDNDFVPVYVDREDNGYNIDSSGCSALADTLVKVPAPVSECINSTNILDNKYLLRYVKYLFSRLGFYQVYATNSNTLVAQDHLCTLVVGDYSTVSL